MKFTYKIITITFLVGILLFTTKGFSQREISPFEEMFTYDYALKYYSNIGVMEEIPDYWFLENFRAPTGVKSIEESPTYPEYSVIKKPYLSSRQDKKKHHYNLNNGFVEQTQLLIASTEIPSCTDTITFDYEYLFDEKQIVINTENKQSLYLNHKQFVFDKQTKNLLLLVVNKKDSTFFNYNLKDHTQVTETHAVSDAKTNFYHPIFEGLVEYRSVYLLSEEGTAIEKNKENYRTDKNRITSPFETGTTSLNVTDNMILFETNYQSNDPQYSRVTNHTVGILFDTAKNVSEFHIEEKRQVNHVFFMNGPHSDIFNPIVNKNLIKKKNKWKKQLIKANSSNFKLPRHYEKINEYRIFLKGYPYKIKKDGIYHKTKFGFFYKYQPYIIYNKEYPRPKSPSRF